VVRVHPLTAASLAVGILLAGYGAYGAQRAVATPDRARAAAETAVSPSSVSSSASSPRTAASTTADQSVFDFEIPTLGGGTFSGRSLIGRDTVLWFWSPGCTICRVETPQISALSQQFAGKVAFVGVAGNGQLNDMRSFAVQQRIPFPQLADQRGTLFSRFGVTMTPAYAFVNQDGRIQKVLGSTSQRELADRLSRLASS
jgi:peroxiredoxin